MRRIVLLLLTAALMACAGTPPPDTDPRTARTTVRVENRAFNDMTIYVLRGAERVRLGIATGHATTVLEIPRGIVTTAMGLRFLANPIGATGTPISDDITVRPGDEVTLMIPPR
ncbi:MAG: hypothetical protein M3373_00190 [Gemmatimonadota bacterium]|nr:hypothetical protein [Gemmatimonadota bacterium]